jgi:hypothetical protein
MRDVQRNQELMMDMSDQLVTRHRAFWDRAEVTQPLCDYFVGGLFPLALFKDGMTEGPLEPAMIIPEAFEDYHRRIGFFVPSHGQLLETVVPYTTIPWMEAIMGCPVTVSTSSDSMSSRVFIYRLEDLDRIRGSALDPENPWLKKLLEYQRFLVQSFGSERPVGHTILRGPADMAAAALGADRMVFELHDHPRRMEELLRICSDVWLNTVRKLTEIVPPYQGGYFSYRLIHSPGPSPVLQEDSAAILSPSLYRDFVFPEDERILASFPYAFYHTHSSSMRILLDQLLSCPDVKAIDSTWDLPPFGPPVETLMPSYHRIQAAGKALYIVAVGDFADKDLTILRELSPRGLCIFFQAKDHASGHKLAAVIDRTWGASQPPQ